MCRSCLGDSVVGCLYNSALSGRERLPKTLFREEGKLLYKVSSLCVSYSRTHPLQENYKYLKEKLTEVATKHGERVLHTPKNSISIG